MNIGVVCFNFQKENKRYQPWRYIYEISKGIQSSGKHNITILTDGSTSLPKEEMFDGILIQRITQITTFPYKANIELLTLIQKRNFDLIFWSIGPLSFQHLQTFKQIKIPIIGLFTGPVFSLYEIIRLGFPEILRSFDPLSIHILNSITPKYLLRTVVNHPSFSSVITMSNKNKNNLVKLGCDKNKIFQVPNGVELYDLLIPENIERIYDDYYIDKNNFIITYFSPPLTIRGADTVIHAAAQLKNRIPDFNLILLSRNDGRFNKEEDYLNSLIIKFSLQNTVKIVSKILTRDDVKRFILISNVVTIPFKIVQSDVPLIILEVMALGKPLISTDVDGIPELLSENRGIIVEPANPKKLADKLFYIYSNPEYATKLARNAQKYMYSYPKWDAIADMFLTLIEAYNKTN